MTAKPRETGLPEGVYSARDIALRNSLTGKSLLDVGSPFGSVAIDALKHGASHAVATDLGRNQQWQAEENARALGLAPDFERADIEAADPRDFDIVVVTNVLHNYRDPLRVLRTLALTARERMIIQANSLDEKSARKHARFQGWLGRRRLRELNGYPVAYVGPYMTPKWGQSFIATASALRSILDGHMRLFQDIHEYGSHKDAEFLLECVRLRIGRLIVVGGVNSSGKSTLCDRLARNEFISEIGADISKAVFTAPSLLCRGPTNEVFKSAETPLSIFHYDISSPDDRGLNFFARDPSTDLLHCADSVDVVLVAPTRETLRQQQISANKQRYIEMFDRPNHLAGVYTEWVEFCGSIPTRPRFFIYKESGNERRMVSLASEIDAVQEIRRLYG